MDTDADIAQAALLEAELAAPRAPTMGVVQKMRYSHADMIDFIIANPGVSQNALASRYGYTPSWISNVMASDAWKAAMAARREELVDPVLLASIEEKFRAVAEKSLERLMEKLSAPVVSDNVVLKAAELGAKALNVGGHAAPQSPKESDHLIRLAARMLELSPRPEGSATGTPITVEGEVLDVKAA